MSQRPLALLLACLTLLSPVCAVAAPPAKADHRADAREHMKKGTTLYGLGKYLEASTEFEEAYAVKPEAGLLYNAAQSARLGGDIRRARTLYSSYVSFHPDGSNLADAKTHLEQLDQQIEAEDAAKRPPEPAPVATVEEKPKHDRTYLKKWWFWTAVGGGAAVVVLAVGLGVGLTRPAPKWSTEPDIGPGAPLGLRLRF